MTRAYEAKLWLNLYRENRKLGDMVASLDALKHAEHLSGRELHCEMAKWFWKKGSVSKAARLLLHYNSPEKWDPHVSLIQSIVSVEAVYLLCFSCRTHY